MASKWSIESAPNIKMLINMVEAAGAIDEDDNIFFPINSEHPSYGKLLTFKEKLYKESDPKFVLFWNNRNIRRKSPGDIILAYKKFAESIPEEDRNNILLLMHSIVIRMSFLEN